MVRRKKIVKKTVKKTVKTSVKKGRKAAPVVTVASARSFIRAVKLPLPPARLRTRGGGEAAPALDATKNQSLVVGSSVVAFVEGVSPPRREEVQNCLLLAQLAAKKAVPDTKRVGEWFKVYFDTLSRIGWAVQGITASKYAASDDDLEAHEAVISVVASLLGGAAPAALLLVKNTLEALKSMNQNQPFITIFNRESRHGRAAHLQVNVVEGDGAGGAAVYLVALELEARASITQVLFFKFRHDETTMRHHAGRATINASVLDTVGADIRTKVGQYLSDYIKEIPI